jgi:hypothetical protein
LQEIRGTTFEYYDLTFSFSFSFSFSFFVRRVQFWQASPYFGGNLISVLRRSSVKPVKWLASASLT